MVASSDSSSVLLVCLASVFWASWRTKILPLKTPRALPSRMPLYSSWLAQCGLAWSMTVWLSMLLAGGQVQAVDGASPPSPSKRTLTSLRDEPAAEA